MTSEQEWDAFKQQLPELLANPSNLGKFALIHGGRVADLFDSQEAGLSAGYDRFGLEPFLVQEITGNAKPKYFSRNVPRIVERQSVGNDAARRVSRSQAQQQEPAT